MGRALLAIPPFVPHPGVGIISLIAPTDVALVSRDVGQHRIVFAAIGATRAALARLGHASSLRERCLDG